MTPGFHLSHHPWHVLVAALRIQRERRPTLAMMFPGKVTLFVPGKLPSSTPFSLVRTSQGKFLLVNGVETEPTEMCVSWEAQPGMLHSRCQSQVVPPSGGLVPSLGNHRSCSARLMLQVSFQFLGWGGRPGILAWAFLAGDGWLSCWTHMA